MSTSSKRSPRAGSGGVLEERAADRTVAGGGAGAPPVEEAAWPRQPQQPLLVFLDGGQIREEPLVPVRCGVGWRVDGARRREATAAAGLDRRRWRLSGHDLR